MKKIISSLMLIFLCNTSIVFAADYYKVNVKRIDSNIYKDLNSKTLIFTKYCYEYAYGEEAVLKYDRYSYDNKLIFDSGTSCDVDKVVS